MRFNHLHGHRKLNRKEWKALSSAFRKENGSEFVANMIQNMCHQSPYGSVHYTIQDRAKLAIAIEGLPQDGMIGWHVSGMDCDCTRYNYTTNREFGGLFALQREYYNSMNGAEGPHHVSFNQPFADDELYHESRDLAMEAYEDGHPHVIYT